MKQRGQIVQLFFQMNTAGPVNYSVKIKGLTQIWPTIFKEVR